MSTESIKLIEGLVTNGSAATLLALALVGAVREWWVSGAAYRRSLAETREWKDLALRATDLADRGVRVASREGGGHDRTGA